MYKVKCYPIGLELDAETEKTALDYVDIVANTLVRVVFPQGTTDANGEPARIVDQTNKDLEHVLRSMPMTAKDYMQAGLENSGSEGRCVLPNTLLVAQMKHVITVCEV